MKIETGDYACSQRRGALLGALFALAVGAAQVAAQAPAPNLGETSGFAASNPLVAQMMAQVQLAALFDYDGKLSGVAPVVVGGAVYTIVSRNTLTSGDGLAKATQYVYEHLQSLGLTVSYQNWSGCGGTSNRNVIGEKRGTESPGEIIIIMAHLDDMPETAPAPGADDNASGSTALLIAADVLSRYQFQRTIRFLSTTGEEQDYCGASAYAKRALQNHENIVAVYNLDMIGWHTQTLPIVRLHTRRTSNASYAGDLVIANTFATVVSAYGMSNDLVPVITADGELESDHSAFWSQGYPAILAIEDDWDDFDDYYHTAQDRLTWLNLPYFTSFVKASVGTLALLAAPVDTHRNPIYLPMFIKSRAIQKETRP